MLENSTVGARISNARITKGYSEHQLAQRIGVQASSIEHWESGEREPRANRLNQLAGVLDVSIMWLMAGDDSPSTADSPDFHETKRIEEKLYQAEKLVNQLSFLLSELRGDTKRVQRDIDEAA